MMTSETLVSLEYGNRDGTFTADVGVVSSADRLQIEAMIDGTLENYVSFVRQICLGPDHECFTLPRKFSLCANTHRKVSLLYVCQYTDEHLCVVYIECAGKFTVKAFQVVSTWNEMRSVASC